MPNNFVDMEEPGPVNPNDTNGEQREVGSLFHYMICFNCENETEVSKGQRVRSSNR